MKSICLTGIDGAGKTSLARNLVNVLKMQGVSAVYIYGRIFPLLSRVLMALGRATKLRKHNPWNDYQGYSANKMTLMKNPFLKGAYTLVVIFDYYLIIWLKLLPHIFRQRILVFDRYLYDVVVSDLAVHLDYSAHRTERMINWGFRFLPIPDRTILIDLDPLIAFSRKNDVIHIDYLTERRERYLQLCQRPEVEIISGENMPEVTQQIILKKINSLFFTRK